jgi:hypothetical protein
MAFVAGRQLIESTGLYAYSKSLHYIPKARPLFAAFRVDGVEWKKIQEI